MMVISAIMLLSMVVLEFVYATNVNLKLAMAEKERLQAQYLAVSAENLMKVELMMDKQVKAQIAALPIAANMPIDLSQPLCQQFPFSTALIRGFFIGGEIPLFGDSAPQGEGEAKTEDEAAEGGSDNEETKGKSVTSFETEKAQEFLAFDGDFDGQCADEAGRLNMNYFAGLDPAQQVLSGTNQYDSYKLLLMNYFKQDKFKKLFDSKDKVDEIVRNIADWVDKNDIINDLGGVTRGLEAGLYKGANDVPPRNGKFLTLEEVHFVEGVDDTWFGPLSDRLTVYGESKVNVCLAESDVVWGVVLAYASQNTSIPPINPQNDELKQQIIDAVNLSCTGAQPQVSQIAQNIDTLLGITQGQSAGNNLANMITTDARYYSLKLTGQVGDTVVNIKTVLDTKESDPKKWRVLYYKVY